MLRWVAFGFFTFFVLAGLGCGPQLKPDSRVGGLLTSKSAQVETARPVDQPSYYEAIGIVHARFNAVLSSKLMARVIEVRYREGDVVHKGEVLVVLDSRETSASIDAARANLNSSLAGVANARTALAMEQGTSQARIHQAEAAVLQAQATVASAQSKLDLALAGPRSQERTQAHLAVVQADSNLTLATTDLQRITALYKQGAIAARDVDVAQNRYNVAKAQRDAAQEAENIAQEGTRAEDIRAAREAVSQAKGAQKQSEANLQQAKAASMQTQVRKQEIRAAQAQVGQSAASLKTAAVSQSYATIAAPFDGRVVKRNVDPGAMASPGVPLITIEGKQLRLEVSVPERLIASIHTGTNLPIRFDAIQQESTARVDEIVPQGDATSHTFTVKLIVPHSSVKAGMVGRALIPRGRRRAILLPASAVMERAGLLYTFVVDQDGIARLQLVTVGSSMAEKKEILSGISAGDRVIVSDLQSISEGDKVEAR